MESKRIVMITQAAIEDAHTILKLQKLAYHSEAELYNDFSIPPLRQTLDDLKTEFSTRTILKARIDDHLVGSVRAWEQQGTCHIERLIVHPDFQGRGIGTKLMHEIEKYFPDAKRFELFTGHRSEGNIRLYTRLGYQVFKHQRITDTLTFTYMEKKGRDSNQWLEATGETPAPQP